MSDESAADFMRDELEALLASPALARVAERHSEDGDAVLVSEESFHASDTEPSIEVQVLRDALRAGLK
jgi:hypothetical protein